MDTSIVTQIDEKRKRRALSLAAQGHITHLKGATFRILFRHHNNSHYTVRIGQVEPETTGTCTCSEYAEHNTCVHIVACGIFILAGRTVKHLVAKHKTDLYDAVAQLSNIAQIAHVDGNRTLHTKCTILYYATNLMLHRQHQAQAAAD